MAFKKIPLTIDTMIRNPVPVEGINQEDNIELNIVVTENKTPKDLSGQTIKVYVRRIDGTLVEQTDQITPTNASKGEVTVKLKNSAFNKEGYALFQLDVSDSDGRITSSYATFKIGKGLVNGEAIANTNEIEALKKVEEYIKKANQELETFKQTVAEINENEATRQENEVLRGSEELERKQAEEKRVAAETKREEEFNKFEGKINANTEELKKARSATTGEVFDTLDERIDHEVDRLNKKIDVTMLQQEDKESHIIENTVEGVTSDMVVKGRTLQNLCSSKLVTINVGQVFKNIISPLNLLQVGKTYTIIYNLTKTSSINEHCTPYLESASGARIYEQATANYNISTGIKKWTITLSSDFEPTQLCFWVQGHNSDVEIKDFIIIEGDYTNKPIPAYFEGIKSFGQQEDKISILSHGKNLFDKSQYSKYENQNGDLEFTAIGNTRVNNFFYIFKEKNYRSKPIFAGSDSLEREFTTTNQTKYYIFVGLNGDKQDNKVWGEIILPPNTKCYYSANNEKGDNFVRFKNIQIEVGTSKTNYESYKEDKKDILLSSLGFDEGLRGINSISDEINYIKKVAIERIGKREYREGDLLLDNVITDKVNTYYVLEEPIETPLNENINLKTFNERTYVDFENSIKGTSSFKAPVNTLKTIAKLSNENTRLKRDLALHAENTIATDEAITDYSLDMDYKLCLLEMELVEIKKKLGGK